MTVSVTPLHAVSNPAKRAALIKRVNRRLPDDKKIRAPRYSDSTFEIINTATKQIIARLDRKNLIDLAVELNAI